jgi:hypothetical protein
VPPPTFRSPGRVRHQGVVGATWLAATVFGSAVGCRPAADIRPDDIRTYTVPKGAEPAAVAGGGGESSSRPAAPGPDRRTSGIRYDVPEGWTDGGAGGMRLATLVIGDAADGREVTVIPASGTLAGNVERWQGQLDTGADSAAIKERAAAAIAAAETVDVDGTPATIVLLRAAADAEQTILGAMIPVDEASALFVKFKGEAAVADRERERFTRFVSSIRWKEQ